ncbi:MAG: VTC domain-containing protein [Oscillospiraceae bacterium]|nr:VTC domain-containing protein [Oscillospiraceae bacterium]
MGRSTVTSLYLDTPDCRIIRNSIEAADYKEKLRLRSYGTASADSGVFLELKKKFGGVVYTRPSRTEPPAMRKKSSTRYCREQGLPSAKSALRML